MDGAECTNGDIGDSHDVEMERTSIEVPDGNFKDVDKECDCALADAGEALSEDEEELQDEDTCLCDMEDAENTMSEHAEEREW